MKTAREIVDAIYDSTDEILEKFIEGKEFHMLFDEQEDDELEVTIRVTNYKHHTSKEEFMSNLLCVDTFQPVVSKVSPDNPELVNKLNQMLAENGIAEIDY